MAYKARTPIEHDGIRYEAGEALPELTDAQLAALAAVGAIEADDGPTEHLPSEAAGGVPGAPGTPADEEANSQASGTGSDDEGREAIQPEPAGDEATPAAGDPAADAAAASRLGKSEALPNEEAPAKRSRSRKRTE
jgi:hypothetical protein